MKVDELLEDVEPESKEPVQNLRAIIKRALPSAEEQVKWGNPTYVLHGQNLACIMIYRDHINLGFFLGAKLKSKRLEGTGKGLRHIKVRKPSDIDQKEFSRLLTDAALLAKKAASASTR